MNRILVLDGDHKNSLAIIRHLGRTKEYTIDVVSHQKASVCFYSKYVSKTFMVRSPKKYPDDYIADILDILKETTYLLVIPVSYVSFQLFAKHKALVLEHTHVKLASYENITLASSKVATYHLAEKLGVPYPRIVEINDLSELDNIVIDYPCVIKAPFELGKNLVDYAYSKEELLRKYKQMYQKHDFKGAFPIVQEYIDGEGAGFFAFYDKGQCANYFMHKRIREYPVTGGASVVAEAYYNEQILADGKKILDSLQWDGVAMVEFKKNTKTGVYNLMEINAKFWGSLELALVSGANFPQLLIDSARGKKIEKWDYKNKRFQWILNGDVLHVLERPQRFFSFWRDFMSSHNDIWWRDLKPNLFQLVYIPVHYYKKWFK